MGIIVRLGKPPIVFINDFNEVTWFWITSKDIMNSAGKNPRMPVIDWLFTPLENP
jgi:hypothetical protein